jgi:hypothetical protein
MLSQKKATTKNQFNICIHWEQETMPWNEICCKVLEVFGLPGGRYTSTPATDFIVFSFKSEKDYKLCEILLSEYL